MRSLLNLTRGAAVAGALTLTHVPAALAAGGERTPLNLSTTTAHHASSGSGSGILRTIIALVVVIAVIYGVAMVLRKVKGGGGLRASGDGLSHLATLPLGPGKSVALVRSGRDIVLVGIGENGITPIKTYTQEEAIANGIDVGADDEFAPGFVDDSGRGGGFIEQLRKLTVRS
jgi:flagellar protein FliO/FliZ